MQIRKIKYLLVSLAALFAASWTSYSQDGTYNGYTPYSVYGIGDISADGTGISRLMGGTGIAMRDRRSVNTLNPAAVTARDSLSFMADFGLAGTNYLYRQGDITSAKNTLNMSNFAISFPIYRSSAMMVGISPFSNMGYDFTSSLDDPLLLSGAGSVTSAHKGTGGMYQLFGAAGVTFWNSLSLGVEGIYYFGSIEKNTAFSFSNTSYRSFSSGHTLQLNAMSAKFGVQWEMHLPKNTSVTLGATYRLPAKLKGYSENYTIATISSAVDTVGFSRDTLGRHYSPRIPSEIGIGLSVSRGDRWSLEVDYTRSDWTKSDFDSTPGFSSVGDVRFAGALSQGVRAGFAYTPNRYDTRYYMRRCTYRGGAYYNQSHFSFDGSGVRAFGLTFGITLPILRYYNAVTLGMDIGQRGSLQGNGVLERYAAFSVSFNIHDLWFMKYRYE